MEQQGDELMAKGEKNLKSGWLRSSNADGAHEKFLQAATQYKAAGKFDKAAHAYKRAADASGKCDNEAESIVELEEAARMLTKAGDAASALSYYTQVVEMHERKQKYVNAAKVCVAAGDIAPGQDAIRWLERAAKLYKLQGSKVTATDIVEKIASAKAKCGDYQGATQLFDELGREALDDRVSRGNARKLFFNALLAQIAQTNPNTIMEDAGVLQERFEEYQELDTQFNSNTREFMVIRDVIEAIQAEDPDAYDAAVKEFDSIVPLDPTQEQMFLKGKQALRARVNDLR